MTLPSRIFFAGAPGSRWSGVAQLLESTPGFNTTDRTPERTFHFPPFSDHLGAYFGSGMEFDLSLDLANIDSAHTTLDGCRLIKAHEWAFHLDQIKQQYPDDWICLIYRADLLCFAWWNGAGGFNITYPRYDAFKDAVSMMNTISQINQAMLEFSHKHNATWNHLTPEWVKTNFGEDREVDPKFRDMLITLIK
jgi:hypothetical protein